ncbi:hypothetical protein [Methylobacterium nodulans]|uniref:hypothetical protein n=1 Tax=Methylobacterium nodulans TaxID=114616 RepID=UPI0012EDE0DE|nr:hypothetical protein [Methylobacterium nodulans]
MRAVVISFIAVLSAGQAWAGKVCSFDKATLRAEKTRLSFADSPHLGFQGARFKVKRWASTFSLVPEGQPSEGSQVGYVAVEIQGRKGSFIIRQDFMASTVPSVVGDSWVSGDGPTNRPIDWTAQAKQHAEKFTGRVTHGAYPFIIYTGPLGSHLLQVVCP